MTDPTYTREVMTHVDPDAEWLELASPQDRADILKERAEQRRTRQVAFVPITPRKEKTMTTTTIDGITYPTPEPPKPSLSPAHREELEKASAIRPQVIADRGYQSIGPAEVTHLPKAFQGYQHQPGLLIPIHTVRGTIESWQLKPLKPRIGKNGKPIKYETAALAPQVLDVPPSVLQYLKDPKWPMVITEGAKKVDSAISSGLPCTIGLQGVYGWRGTNADGGKTALSDWEQIALNGRQVMLAFDSDVMTKSDVRGALTRLASFLSSRGARVRYLLLPHLPNGNKCGLDDWFALGNTRESLSQYLVKELPSTVPTLQIVRMSDVQMKPIDWLWPNWLPKGMLTLLGGYAGDGKSTISLALAAALSNGGTLPDGTQASAPVNTLLALAEDDLGHVVKQRLDVHKADHHRVHALEMVKNPDGEERNFNLRTDVPLLREIVEQHEIGLIIIDPMSSFLANGDRNNEGDVRDTLTPLIQMLEETGAAAIGIMHIGKGDGQAKAMQKLMGSTAFIALARSVWMVSDLPLEFQQEGEPTRKMLAVSKSNYAVKPAALQFCRPIDGAVTYLGQSPVDVEAVWSWKPQEEKAPTEPDKAEAWLVAFMDGKPVSAADVEQAGKAEGFSLTTLKRAKARLGLRSAKKGGQWHWLPGDGEELAA